MNDIKITYLVEFPRIGRVLCFSSERHKTAIVRVTNGSTGRLLAQSVLRITTRH